MIKKETIIINGKNFERTFSDEGFYVARDGVKYVEAVDPINSGREYAETDEKIESEGN